MIHPDPGGHKLAPHKSHGGIGEKRQNRGAIYGPVRRVKGKGVGRGQKGGHRGDAASVFKGIAFHHFKRAVWPYSHGQAPGQKKKLAARGQGDALPFVHRLQAAAGRSRQLQLRMVVDIAVCIGVNQRRCAQVNPQGQKDKGFI
jgi:hypothetical protein